MTDKLKANGRVGLVLLVLFMSGLGVSGAIAFGVYQNDQQSLKTEMRARMANVADQVETKVAAHVSAVKGIRAYFSANGFESTDRFLKFIDGLGAYDIGSVVQGWAPRVPLEHEKTVEQILRTQNSSAPFINELIEIGALDFADDGLSMFPVASALPQEVGKRFTGLDLASLGAMKGKIESAIRQDEVSMSGPLQDIPGVQNGHAVVAILPFYRSGLPAAVLIQKPESTLGIVFSVIDLNRIIQHSVTSSSIIKLVRAGGLSIRLVHEGSEAKAETVYQSDAHELVPNGSSNSILRPIYGDQILIDLNGLRLQMAYSVDLAQVGPNYMEKPAFSLAAGVALTLLLCSYVYSLITRQRHVNAMVQERTRDLEMNQQRLRDMAEISSDWFWRTDADNKFVEVSQRLKTVTGIDPEKFYRKTRVEALELREDQINLFWRKHLDCLKRREKFTDFRYCVERENGDVAWLSISGKPVYGDDQAFIGYHGSGRDVTQEELAKEELARKEREMQSYIEELEVSRQYLERNTVELAQMAEEYAVAKECAEASERSKSEFLASMSHEIRTPMTSVMGFADMLLDGDLGDGDREKITQIKQATQSLLGIIDDILDLSKLEAGRMEMENLDFNLHQMIDEAMDLIRERANAKGLALNVNHSSNVPHGINADPTRFRQVLINLLGNAVKFTQVGEVSIHTEIQLEENGDVLKVSIRDTGIGIDEENQKKLFQSFTQADASTSRNFSGTGLGLAISRRLVRLMGGDVSFKSEVGVGSEFCFTLPFTPATEDVTFIDRRKITRDFVATRSLHILIAEDNLLNQRIVEATLQKYGHTMHIVENGLLATEAVTAHIYDLVLMDVRMPEMNGTDATRAIRGASHTQSEIPIIALTADAMEEHVSSYLAAGMNACVTKPIDRENLLLIVNQVLSEEVHVPGADKFCSNQGQIKTTPNSRLDEAKTEASIARFLRDIQSLSPESEKVDATH